MRELVRRAARVVDKRPSEFLRLAAEEKARAVLREAAGEDLRKLVITGEWEAEYRRAVEYPQVRRQAAPGESA